MVSVFSVVKDFEHNLPPKLGSAFSFNRDPEEAAAYDRPLTNAHSAGVRTLGRFAQSLYRRRFEMSGDSRLSLRGCEKIPWQGLPAAAPECCGWKPQPRFTVRERRLSEPAVA